MSTIGEVLASGRIKAHVWCSHRSFIHIGSTGVLNEDGHRLCTARCRPLYTWNAEVTVDGVRVMRDNTGAWAPMYEYALEVIHAQAAAIVAGLSVKL